MSDITRYSQKDVLEAIKEKYNERQLTQVLSSLGFEHFPDNGIDSTGLERLLSELKILDDQEAKLQKLQEIKSETSKTPAKRISLRSKMALAAITGILGICLYTAQKIEEARGLIRTYDNLIAQYADTNRDSIRTPEEIVNLEQEIVKGKEVIYEPSGRYSLIFVKYPNGNFVPNKEITKWLEEYQSSK